MAFKKHEVFMENSRMNAIFILNKNCVDLISFDYEMFVVPGLQVFEMLKKESSTQNIPIIFFNCKR